MSEQQARPLLSICIPTYNRAEYLEQCLEAIVHQEGFDERVEIVISDNASTDGTQALCKRYSKQFPNVIYHRNSENVADGNFPIVLSLAHGVLRKLSNDVAIYEPGAVKCMLNIVLENIDKRPQIYFLNSGKGQEAIKIITLEQYITTLSYNLTWISSITVWDDDCNDLSTFINNSSSHLGQVPYLLEHFEKHHGAIVYNRQLMSGIPLKKKNLTYGLYQVFYVNFLGFIRKYLDVGKISERCYENVRKDLLLNFFCPWIVNFQKHPDKYLLSNENLKELVEKEYRNAPYYWKYKIKSIFLFFYFPFKATLKKFLTLSNNLELCGWKNDKIS